MLSLLEKLKLKKQGTKYNQDFYTKWGTIGTNNLTGTATISTTAIGINSWQISQLPQSPYMAKKPEVKTPEERRKEALRRIVLQREAAKEQGDKLEWEANPNPDKVRALRNNTPHRKATPQIGDSSGGYALVDKVWNILDIWDKLKETEACDKFNKLKIPGAIKPEKRPVFLVAITNQGTNQGILGWKSDDTDLSDEVIKEPVPDELYEGEEEGDSLEL